jgi:hypothetical protein
MRCAPGGRSQRRRRPVASPPLSSTHVAPPPELGPRAPTRASHLAATRRAAMRRRRGRRGRHWPLPHERVYPSQRELGPSSKPCRL